jgi:hypothetical protein
MIAIPVSEEDTGQQILEKHSPQTITSNEKISITISSISDGNINKTFTIRIISPNGLATETGIILQPDSLGFSSKTAIYPNNFPGATTKEVGNYTILIQESKTGQLVKSSSFQVGKQWYDDLATSLLNLPPQIILAIAGGGITFGYNILASRRDRTKTLLEKKTTNFLTHATVYFQVINIGRSLIKSIYPEENPQFRIVSSDKIINANILPSTGQQRNDNLRKFFLLIRYLQKRSMFYQKLGYNFLDNVRSERLLSEIYFLISEKLRAIFGTVEIEKIKNIISNEDALIHLNTSVENNNEAKELFGLFEESLSSRKIDVVLLLISLHNYQILYDINRFSKDWYTNKKEHKKTLKEIQRKLYVLKNQAKNIPDFNTKLLKTTSDESEFIPG